MYVISNQTLKAKKVHKCSYCLLPINIGEVYERQAINNDGFYIWKCHESCGQLPEILGWFNYSYDGLTQEDFNTGVQEKYFELTGKPRDGKTPFAEMLKYVKEKVLIKQLE